MREGSTTKAIVLTGSGSAYCAGIDLLEAKNAPGPASRPSQEPLTWTQCQAAIRAHPAVFNAAVNGFALGGGSTLVNNCELAVAAESATDRRSGDGVRCQAHPGGTGHG